MNRKIAFPLANKDVMAARGIGAHCIGIPSGNITFADLKSAGAIRVVKKVSDELIFAIEEVIHAPKHL
ncbi:MAG: hypothetical protein JXR76_28430 [Deltaproteobacteria bacterium]|nr:hypothetical protein [Deltaproteobacteria bacterium]